MSLLTILGLIFVILRLTGHIDWHILFILLPFIVDFGLHMFVAYLTA